MSAQCPLFRERKKRCATQSDAKGQKATLQTWFEMKEATNCEVASLPKGERPQRNADKALNVGNGSIASLLRCPRQVR